MKKLNGPKKTPLAISLAWVVAVVSLSAGGTALAQEEEYVAIAKVAPAYPDAAVSHGLEGHVIVEFTLTEEGTIRDPHVIESSSTLFEQPALDAVGKWRYGPTRINGQPVAGHYLLRLRIVFALDDDPRVSIDELGRARREPTPPL